MQTVCLNLTMMTVVQYGGDGCRKKLFISFLLAAPVSAGVIISQTAQVYQPQIISQPAVMVRPNRWCSHCTLQSPQCNEVVVFQGLP